MVHEWCAAGARHIVIWYRTNGNGATWCLATCLDGHEPPFTVHGFESHVRRSDGGSESSGYLSLVVLSAPAENGARDCINRRVGTRVGTTAA